MLSTGFDRFNAQPNLSPEVWGVDGPRVFSSVEDKDSPSIEFGEQCTITHKFTGAWEAMLALRAERGTWWTDSNGNVTRTLTCRIEALADKPGCARLTHIEESISFAVPPDEFSYDAVEINPALEKNARYTNPNGAPDATHLSTLDIINIHAALEAPQEQSRTESLQQTPYSPTDVELPNSDGETIVNPGNPYLAALYNELYTKLRRGEENFYLSGIKIVWSVYTFTPWPLDSGNYIQDPSAFAPAQFLVGTQGPVLPEGYSFLRMADSQSYNRTWFKITYTWLGFPEGGWDPDIYSA